MSFHQKMDVNVPVPSVADIAAVPNKMVSVALTPIEVLKDNMRKMGTFWSKEEVKEYYSFKEKLGAGFFATVYRGVEKKSGLAVAIKVIDKSKANDKEEMLEEEVGILGKVHHPNCVTMLEIFESPKHLYVVMELVTGGELFAKICQEKSFNEGDAARMISELCEGLKYLHSLGIVHRDLKPENILLESNQANARIKITDFGLSKMVRGKNKFLQSRCGTPAYAAPELIEGKPYGSKVDMWAVGCILYILLSGCPPFWGNDTNELFARICSGYYPMDTPQMDPISKNAKQLVRRLLVLDPDIRYSADDVLKHPWITGDRKKLSMMQLSSQVGLTEHMKKMQESVCRHEGKDEDLEISLDESAPPTPSLSGSALTFSEEEKALMCAPLSQDDFARLASKYPDWPDYTAEFEKGRLLGADPKRTIEQLSKPSTWKARALQCGYIRPFLLLVSMHPRQRLGFAKVISVDIASPVWFGDPHRESWEIINNQLEGLKAKTKGPMVTNASWWETLVQVSEACLSHFWSGDKATKKSISNRHNFSKAELKQALIDPKDPHIPHFENIFSLSCMDKLQKNKQKKGVESRSVIYASIEDLNKSGTQECKNMCQYMQTANIEEPIILRVINWYVHQGFKDSSDNAIFLTWVEKERALNLSSVFVGKGRSRVLLPIVFGICLQSLILSMYNIHIRDFWPEGDQITLQGSFDEGSSSSPR
mmetsp:Transcript_30359/g.47130  ORF Transcript_30359/g.47130 Transcript_30359/m.47130 type:complete len:708 (-) Transcript_30359:153-2276(-)